MRRAQVMIWLHLVVFFMFPLTSESFNEVGLQASRTPYDSKYHKVETYVDSLRNVSAGCCSPSFSTQQSRIQRYLQIARQFTFQPERVLGSGKQEDLWQLPEETERLGSGDCEDLAIWLYCHLLNEGFTNIRFTLGFAGRENKSMHAWVTWYERGKTYIIDPSRSGGIYGATQPGPVSYEPQFSYYFDKRWHHH